MNGVLETIQLDVACLTTDFAMQVIQKIITFLYNLFIHFFIIQNVMMQMGLHVVSLEGRLIHEARTYILRCYACFRTTTNVMKGEYLTNV